MIKRCETKHNQHRRSYWHDYYQKGLYMITLVMDGRKPFFGTIISSVVGEAVFEHHRNNSLSLYILVNKQHVVDIPQYTQKITDYVVDAMNNQ